MASFADHSPAGRGGSLGAARQTLSHPVLLVLFVLTATQPYSFLFGSILIGPYRLLLIVVSIPLIVNWLRGKYGGIVLPDYLMLGHTLWISVSLIANGQTARIVEYGAAQIFDLFVAYLLGRAAIRSKEDFYFFTKVFLALLIFLVPFAFLEATRGMMILQNLFRGLPNLEVFLPITLTYPERMGFMRAMTTINHPIVYGVFCSIGFALGVVGLKHAGGGTSLFKRAMWSLGSLLGTLLSFSAGALVSLLVQGMLIGWGMVMAQVTRHWQLLAGGFGALYLLLQIVAERPPLLVMARYVAFSGSTTWNRYLTWQYGTDEVMRHPIFGMGLFYQWIRAPWMPTSVDNHWLLMAMRWGIPGVALLLAAYFVVIVRLARTELVDKDPAVAAIRDAFIFMFIGIFASLGTVVAWHVTYSMILMLLGGAVWIFNEHDTAARPAAAEAPRGRTRRGGPVYSRAAAAHGAARPAQAQQGGRTNTARKPAGDASLSRTAAGDTGTSGASGTSGRKPVYTRFADASGPDEPGHGSHQKPRGKSRPRSRGPSGKPPGRGRP